jgi:membrane protease YdiL (CAAX protease family)
MTWSSSVVVGAVFVFAWAWLHGLQRLVAGRPLIEPTARRPVPWGPTEIVLAVLLLLLCQGALFEAVRNWRGWLTVPSLTTADAEGRLWLLSASAAGSLAALAASVAWVAVRTEATWGDLGVVWRRTGTDMGLGVVAFVMIAPPVFGLQLLLVRWFGIPSQHPLIAVLRDHPSPALMAAVVFSAVVVAPLAEEYFFRVLLQGWLERLVRPQLAILASAAAFAVVHTQNGPDPIPLLLFAVGLGYLYRQTHRILPSVVVHLLLNACSLAALFAGQAKP